MIAFLKGKIIAKTQTFVILENAGIGYKLFASPSIIEQSIGTETEVFTYLKSSDDGQSLFAMPNFESLQFFELLLSVTGVGPKLALGIISAAPLSTLQQAISSQDSDIFTRMSGVGKKTAERIILELKTKVSSEQILATGTAHSDVYDALIGLGYSSKEIREVISKLDSGDMTDQLKQALKLLSK